MGSMIPKPPPSKWDDAEKWIVSPGYSDQSPAQPHHQALPTGRRNSITGAQNFRYPFGADCIDFTTPPGEKPMSPQFERAFINAGQLESSIHATTTLKKHSKALSFGDLSRRFEPSAGKQLQPVQQPHLDTVLCRQDDARSKAQTINPRAMDLQVPSSQQQAAQSPKHARLLSMEEMSKVVVAPVCFPEPSICQDMGTQMTPAESLRIGRTLDSISF